MEGPPTSGWSGVPAAASTAPGLRWLYNGGATPRSTCSSYLEQVINTCLQRKKEFVFKSVDSHVHRGPRPSGEGGVGGRHLGREEDPHEPLELRLEQLKDVVHLLLLDGVAFEVAAQVDLGEEVGEAGLDLRG